MHEITLYGDVGWEITARGVNDALASAPDGEITIRINSPGGAVFDGIAIASMIRRRGGVTAVIDGLAASAASVIAVGADRRVMAQGAMLMIHNPWSMAAGGSSDLRKEADVLDVIAGELAKMYASASGGKLTVDQAREMMDAETWLTAEDALAVGLVHAIEGNSSAMAKIDTTRHAYKRIPKGLQTMSTETKEAKPSFLDRLVATIKVDSSAIQAELSEAQSALVDAVAKIADAEARASEAVAALASAKAEHQAEMEKIKAEHAAAITAAVEAAKIEAAQETTAQMLKENAPEALPHAETVEGAASTHTATWNALRAAGDYTKAGEYYSKYHKSILIGE